MQTLALTAVAALLLGPAVPAVAQESGALKWERAAPFPDATEELYAATANGRMYVFGGGNPSGRTWEYDPIKDQWTRKKPMPIPINHAAVTEFRGKLYLFGGFVPVPNASAPGSVEVQGHAWEYDPAADAWRELAPMPTRRGSPVAITVGNLIYVIGGAAPNPGAPTAIISSRGPSRSLSTNEAYDPVTNQWVEKSPMPTPRNHMFAGAVNGKIYIIGGRIPNQYVSVAATNIDVVEEYDTVTDQWGPQKARLPTARSGGGYATYGGKIYTAGGEVQTAQMWGAFLALEAYDPVRNSWSQLPSMPVPRHGVAAAFLGNKLHLVSGRIASGGYTSPDTQLATDEHDVLAVPEVTGH